MAAAVYILCFLTSFTCTVLLLRSYRKNHVRLLLWSGICFAGLSLNNALLFLDLVVWPNVDMFLVRATATLLGLVVLIFGLIWEEN